MSEVLGDFIRALRAADIRVSTSESIDAGNVIDLVGFGDRATLRDALSQVLAKSEDEKQAFTDTFDTYFSFEQFKKRPASVDEAAANENDGSEGQESEEKGGEGESGEGGDPSQSGNSSSPGGGSGGERQGERASAPD
ncbi:MAG: VWA containing CoxE family protein, partial [Alphaproteobacteria bacterium HGW-Alphaproteobacteria-12]